MLKSIFENIYIIRERKKADANFRRSIYSLSHLQRVVQRDLNLQSVTTEKEVVLSEQQTPVGKIQLIDRFKRLLVHQRFKQRGT